MDERNQSMMKRMFTVTVTFVMTLVAATVVGMARPAPAEAQIFLCFPTYVLINGRCPIECPLGWAGCPCATCINLL